MSGCGGVAWEEGDGDEGDDDGWRLRLLLLEIKAISVLI
jgi:hypothetical protein